MEVWKYWWQLLGLLPSDELQRLRAENEVLKAQLEISKTHARMANLNEEAVRSWMETSWSKVFKNPFTEENK